MRNRRKVQGRNSYVLTFFYLVCFEDTTYVLDICQTFHTVCYLLFKSTFPSMVLLVNQHMFRIFVRPAIQLPRRRISSNSKWALKHDMRHLHQTHVYARGLTILYLQRWCCCLPHWQGGRQFFSSFLDAISVGQSVSQSVSGSVSDSFRFWR